MARPIRFDESYYDDVKALKQRGYKPARIASELGMSRATYYRLTNRHRSR